MAGKGYNVNDKALSIISLCDDWYANRVIKDFHTRKNLNDVDVELTRMNFAKRCCADDANLCEIISVAPEKESGSEEFINSLLDDNRFDVMYREQLEKISASGTAGAYIYLRNGEYVKHGNDVRVRGGEIRINYCDADCIIPLTVENKLVTECAFAVTNMVKGKDKTTLVIFTLNNGIYEEETVVFDDNGHEIPEEGNAITLGDVKPFGIIQNAEVNNIDGMLGYGLPKIYNNIWLFKAIDLCFNILYGDLDKGEKMVFINELLATISTDENGRPMLTPKQKKLFIMLGEKLPDEDSVIKEYNPEIRTKEITEAFELVLSLISMQFGYGTKKYSFENGQIQTATEYIGEKQDELQELNKQRKQATAYIEDIIHAAMWFANNFQSASFNVQEELSIEFDDSYVEDKASKLEGMRNDALSFPDIKWLTIQYLQAKYNLSEEEATNIANSKNLEEAEEDFE